MSNIRVTNEGTIRKLNSDPQFRKKFLENIRGTLELEGFDVSEEMLGKAIDNQIKDLGGGRGVDPVAKTVALITIF